MAYQAGHAAKSRNPDSVHDFRVSIRRLSQSLRIFREFFPPGAAKKIRKSLKGLMQAASEVRNRDIALELLERANMTANTALVQSISQERRDAEEALLAALRRWTRRHSFQRWRSRLGL
jgi:CHAD domain-containing protein